MPDLEFLSKLGGMFVDIGYLALIGGTVGTIIALAVDRSSVLSSVAVDLLHTILWFPFFVVYALPEWPIHQWIPIALAGGTISTTLFVCHGLLAVRSALHLTWLDAFLVVGRNTILHAFLFSIYYQIHHEAGWIAELSLKGIPCYAILPVLCGFLFLIDQVFRANFDEVAERDGKVLLSLLKNRVRTHLLSVFLGGSICLGLWYSFRDFVAQHFLLGNPVEVLRASYAVFSEPSC